MAKITLVSRQSKEAIDFLVANGYLEADGGERMFKSPDFQELKKGYDFIVKCMPPKPMDLKAQYPIWAFKATKFNVAECHKPEEDAEEYCIIFEKEKDECLYTHFSSYEEAVFYGSPLIPEEEWDDEKVASMSQEDIEATWPNMIRKRATEACQVTTWQIRMEEIISIELI